MRPLRASFEVVGLYRCGFFNALVIRDLGIGLTVTNDAEAVVWNLRDRLNRNTRLFYYDSWGSLDELVHDGEGKFLRFATGPIDTSFFNNPVHHSNAV